MGSVRRAGNTAGKHLEQHHPLPKGQACSSCKARKVRCSAGTPACQACMRTAKFEGRDPTAVVCRYDGLKCGVKGGKGKGKGLEKVEIRDDAVTRLENEMAQFEEIVRANLKALPSRTSSTSSSASSSSATGSASTSTSLASSSLIGGSPIIDSPTIEAPSIFFPPQLPPVTTSLFDLWSYPSYAVPSSPDSFYSASSYESDCSALETDTPPEHFLTSHHADDTLSLPLFFPLPLSPHPLDANFATAPHGGAYTGAPLFAPDDYWREQTWLGNDWSMMV